MPSVYIDEDDQLQMAKCLTVWVWDFIIHQSNLQELSTWSNERKTTLFVLCEQAKWIFYRRKSYYFDAAPHKESFLFTLPALLRCGTTHEILPVIFIASFRCGHTHEIFLIVLPALPTLLPFSIDKNFNWV